MVVAGLPLHILLVHAVVVLVPLAALCTVLAAVWPAARRRLGVASPLLALVALVLVPITTAAGEWLEDRVGATPLVQRHAALGTGLLPWAIALFAVAVAVWLWHRFAAPRLPAARPAVRRGATVVLAALALATAAVATTQVMLIGESGSRAVWENSFRSG